MPIAEQLEKLSEGVASRRLQCCYLGRHSMLVAGGHLPESITLPVRDSRCALICGLRRLVSGLWQAQLLLCCCDAGQAMDFASCRRPTSRSSAAAAAKCARLCSCESGRSDGKTACRGQYAGGTRDRAIVTRSSALQAYKALVDFGSAGCKSIAVTARQPSRL